MPPFFRAAVSLFVASLFASAAFSGALVEGVITHRVQVRNGESYYLTRQLIGSFVNVKV